MVGVGRVEVWGLGGRLRCKSSYTWLTNHQSLRGQKAGRLHLDTHDTEGNRESEGREGAFSSLSAGSLEPDLT